MVPRTFSHPAGALAANAATLPKDIVSAIASAAINNVMRFLIASHPLSLVAFNNTGPKRETHGGRRHTLKPHPLLRRGAGLSLQGSLCVLTPPPFGNPATPLSRRRGARRLCAPALQRVCLYRGAEAPDVAS